MDTTEYTHMKVKTMITDFTKDFKEKTGLDITINLYGDNDILSTLPSPSEKGYPMITLKDLEQIIIETVPFSMNAEKFRSKSRLRKYVDVRTMFSHIARKFNFQYTTIGRYMHKDHSTIIHHQKKANALLQTDPTYFAIYSHISAKIKETYDQVI